MPDIKHMMMQQRRQWMSHDPSWSKSQKRRRRAFRLRQSVELNHYLNIDVAGGHPADLDRVHVHMTDEELARFIELGGAEGSEPRGGVVNIADPANNYTLITKSLQLDMECDGWKGVNVRDVADTSNPIHRQSNEQVGESEEERSEMSTGMRDASKYYKPQQRSCNIGGGGVTCFGKKPNRDRKGYSDYVRASKEPESDEELTWADYFWGKKGPMQKLYNHLWSGSRVDLRQLGECWELVGVEPIIGVYTAGCVFHSCEELQCGYFPGVHEDEDCAPCMILNLDGSGWMVYPTYRIAVEFAHGDSWIFDSTVAHCCTPAKEEARVGLGLYCKLSLAARGKGPVRRLQMPSDTNLNWALVRENMRG